MAKKARTHEWVIVTYGRFLVDRRAPRVTKATCTFWSQPNTRFDRFSLAVDRYKKLLRQAVDRGHWSYWHHVFGKTSYKKKTFRMSCACDRGCAGLPFLRETFETVVVDRRPWLAIMVDRRQQKCELACHSCFSSVPSPTAGNWMSPGVRESSSSMNEIVDFHSMVVRRYSQALVASFSQPPDSVLMVKCSTVSFWKWKAHICSYVGIRCNMNSWSFTSKSLPVKRVRDWLSKWLVHSSPALFPFPPSLPSPAFVSRTPASDPWAFLALPVFRHLPSSHSLIT